MLRGRLIVVVVLEGLVLTVHLYKMGSALPLLTSECIPLSGWSRTDSKESTIEEVQSNSESTSEVEKPLTSISGKRNVLVVVGQVLARIAEFRMPYFLLVRIGHRNGTKPTEK
jgi:hypothetical protein